MKKNDLKIEKKVNLIFNKFYYYLYNNLILNKVLKIVKINKNNNIYGVENKLQKRYKKLQLIYNKIFNNKEFKKLNEKKKEKLILEYENEWNKYLNEKSKQKQNKIENYLNKLKVLNENNNDLEFYELFNKINDKKEISIEINDNNNEKYVTYDKEIIHEEIQEFLSKLLTNNDDNFKQNEKLMKKYEEVINNIDINDKITIKEIDKILPKIKNKFKKKGGIDQLNFIIVYYLIKKIPNIFCKLMNLMFDTDIKPKILLYKLIQTIPKKDEPKEAKDFRGITLTNCIKSIIDMIINNRTYKIIRNGTDYTQGGGFKFRSIHETCITYYIICLKNKREKLDMITVTIDLKKAYDKPPHELITIELKRKFSLYARATNDAVIAKSVRMKPM